MNLKKTYLYSEELASEKFTIMWNTIFKKARIYYLLMPLFGFILIVLGIFSSNSQSTKTSIGSQNTIQHITYFNLNLFLSFGIVVLVVSIIQFIGIIKHKNRLKRKLYLDIDKEKVLEINPTHLVSENGGIIYSVPLSRIHQKVEISNSILLYYEHDPSDYIQIDKRIFTKKELTEFYEFIQAKS